MKLILASGSPRRKELLALLNIPFEVIVSNFDERIDQDKKLEDEIKRLSFGKAKSVFEKNEDAVVIGADTIVTIDNKVLGKPKDQEDAKRMLTLLSNNVHTVITGVTIMSKDKTETFASSNKVYFDQLTDDEIKEYILTKEPMDKAGAYAIQGIGSKFIKKIEGDYYSIVGLPINQIYQKLRAFI